MKNNILLIFITFFFTACEDHQLTYKNIVGTYEYKGPDKYEFYQVEIFSDSTFIQIFKKMENDSILTNKGNIKLRDRNSITFDVWMDYGCFYPSSIKPCPESMLLPTYFLNEKTFGFGLDPADLEHKFIRNKKE